MFYPASLIVPLLVLLPNLLFLIWPAKAETSDGAGDSKTVFALLEGIGRFGLIAAPLFYPLHFDGLPEQAAAVGAIFSLLIYYACWIRYYLRDRGHPWLFAPLYGIPVPMAVSPTIYFLLTAFVLHSPVAFAFGLLFGFGHIRSSLDIYRNQAK